MSQLWQAAEEYRLAGLHPIPCAPRSKIPRKGIEWEEFQHRAPTQAEVASWWRDEPNANIALVLGRGWFVVDLDGEGAIDLLTAAGVELPAAAPRVRTRNGWHVYFRTGGRIPCRNPLLDTNGEKPAVDVKGDGGYVIAPPSIHPEGGAYEWHGDILTAKLAPQNLIELIHQHKRRELDPEERGSWISECLRGVSEGKRAVTTARLAGYFLRQRLPHDVIAQILAPYAKACRPPLTPAEIRNTIASVSRYHPDADPVTDAADTTNDAKAEGEAPLVHHVSAAIDRLIEESNKGTQNLVNTPFPKFNWLLMGGFEPGTLCYIGARPGVGKTAFALQLATHAAKNERKTLVISAEMLSWSLARRILAQEGMLDARVLRTPEGIMSDRAQDTIDRVKALPLWISDSAFTLNTIRAAVREAPEGVDCLIVDYLQILSAAVAEGRRHEVDALSKGLKRIASEFEIPVICLSSLSRPQGGDDKKPTLAALRESGQLEHDAHYVIFLHPSQPPSQLPEDANRQIMAILEKNRDGPVGETPLILTPQWTRFHQMEAGREEY